MKSILTVVLISIISTSSVYSQKYKDMMDDSNINFYDVVKEADTYFETHDKGKGSGWKPFQRWMYENESKYYPSGDRSKADHFIASKSRQKYLQNNIQKKSLFNGSWEDLGPYRVGQITGHYSFGLGRINTFYIDQSNSNRLFIGTETGGFWKTTDGGTTWDVTTDNLAAAGVNAIDVNPNNSNEVLININNSGNHYSHGIYRSLDGGDTWALSNFNPTNVGYGGLGSNFQIYTIKYHPTIANLVFVGTWQGLYRSDDNMATWTRVETSTVITEIDFHPTDANIIYMYDDYYWGTNEDLVFYSTDIGLTFSTSNALTGNSEASISIKTSPDCPNCVYAASGNGLWKSTNSGVTYTLVSNTNPSAAGFAVSDLDDNNILMGYLDAEMSTDGGLNFNQTTFWSLGNTNGAGSGNATSYSTSTNYIHADLQYAECYNGVFYAVTDGFLVSSSDNGISWNILSEGTGIRMNYNLGVSQSNHYTTIVGSQDNGTSIKTQSQWVEFYGADGMEGYIHPLNDDWMIGSLQNGGRRRTKDGGASQDGATPAGQSGGWVAPILYDPNNQMTVYSFGENIHKSEDFGTTWATLGTPSFTGTINYATIAENNTDIIIVTKGADIEKSTDGGNSFASIRGSLPNYSIKDVVFDPNDDDVIVVTYNRYQNDNSKVYISIDGGSNWANITYNLGDMPVRTAIIDHTAESNIYLGTEIGVYKKKMSETSWTLYSTGLPNTTIMEMEVMYGSNTLRASTWGRGLWEFTLDGRQDYPSILTTSITDLPTEESPVEGVDQYVTSTITYDNTITKSWVEWSVATPTFGNVIAMSNTSGNEWVSDTPLPDYPVGTKMFFKVFSLGASGDTTETYKFMYTVKEFAYCDAAGESANGNLYLKDVTIANVANLGTGNDSYSYYGQSPLALEVGSTYTITVVANTSWASNDYGAWIDWNDNSNFDNDELILSSINPASNTATADFTVPANAKVNDTLRMRIRLGYWDSPALDPCGTTLGELEDYPVFIGPNTSLANNDIIFTANVLNKEAAVRLNWIADIENLTGYDVERSVNGTDFNSLSRINNTNAQSLVYLDESPLIGQSYYRLKATDESGSIFYSKIEPIQFTGKNQVTLSPNPINKGDKFSIHSSSNSPMNVTIYDNTGKVISKLNSFTNGESIDVSNYSKGMYLINIWNEEFTINKKLIIE